MIIFWIIQKPYHVHIWWCALGRKLPTAYTSQQLLSGWGQRDIFFQFFCCQKTQKNRDISTHQVTCWHIDSNIRIMSAKVPESCDSGHQNLEILDSKNRTFRTLWRPCSELRIAKICKISKNPQNREKCEKVHFLAVWRVSYVSSQNRCPEHISAGFGRFGQILPNGCQTSQMAVRRSEKSAKISAKISDLGTQKNRKSAPISAAIDDRSRRAWAQIGGKKNALFWTFWRVKAKNFPRRP